MPMAVLAGPELIRYPILMLLVSASDPGRELDYVGRASVPDV
jgi:hypothetical protein